MPALLPPPFGVPYLDASGKVSPQWSAYLLSLTGAIGTGFAPQDAKYWVSTTNGQLTDETNLGLLTSGYLKLTTAIGVGTPSTVTGIPIGDITGGATLSRVDDTNVTLTLGGSPGAALLAAVTLTLGWTGTLGLSRGGTAANLSATGGTSQVLRQSSAGAAVTVSQLASTDISGLASGTYTPTLTNVANLAASTAYQCQYLRVGTVVTVSGKVDVDPTLAATSTQLGISLPIASNLGAAEDCAGTAFSPTIAGQGAAILGDAANNRAQMEWISGDITNQPMYFTFSYEII